MGDGPGYDAMYARMDKEHKRRLEQRFLRHYILLAMFRSVGFGRYESGVDVLVSQKLQEAFDILSAIDKHEPSEEREKDKFLSEVRR